MPNFAANLTMLYNEHDFIDRFAAAAATASRRSIPLPLRLQEGAPGRPAKEHGLTQALHNMPAGDWAAGERGLASLPGREEEFRAGVIRPSSMRRRPGLPPRQLPCRHPAQGRAGAEARRTFVENLKHRRTRVCQGRHPPGDRGDQHPRHPGLLPELLGQAIEIMDEVGSDNLQLQYDFYHMQIMEGDLVPTFRRLKDRIGHVQIADNPGPQRARHRRDPLSLHLRRRSTRRLRGLRRLRVQAQGETSAGLGWFAPYRRAA